MELVRDLECSKFGTIPASGNNIPRAKFKPRGAAMKKKSLTSTLKATKKADVAAAPAKNEGSVTKKIKLSYARPS